MFPWNQITFIGDTVVMLPAAALILAWLLVGRAWSAALLWSVLFSAGLLLVLASKIAYIGWGIGIDALDFTGFSGHAMRAAAVLPVLGSLLLMRATRPIWFAGIALGVAAGILVTVSRVVLDQHSMSEAVSGAMLGSAAGLGYIYLARTLATPRRNPWLIALGIVVLLPTSHAEPAPTNRWVTAAALYLSGHDLPYERGHGRPDEEPVRSEVM